MNRKQRRTMALIGGGFRPFADNGSGDGGSGSGGTGGSGESGSDKVGDNDALTKLQTQLEQTQSELERFQAKHSEAEKHRKEAERKAREQAEESARKSGDVEAIEKSWKEKLETREGELTKRIESLQAGVSKLTAGQTATTIANELAVPGSAKALLPHVMGRLTTEYVDDTPVVRVLDQNGKPSAMTLDELKQEFKQDKAFAPLLAGSRSSGSGGSAQSAAGGGVTIKQADLDARSPKERAKFFRENPDAQVID